MIATTVSELVSILQTMSPSARIYTIEPPFDGVKLVEQGDGAILICRPRSETRGSPATCGGLD